jgi:uncharacterized protein YlaI
MLEDNDERIAAFQKTIGTTGDGFESKVWRNATFMCAECEEYFHTAAPDFARSRSDSGAAGAA